MDNIYFRQCEELDVNKVQEMLDGMSGALESNNKGFVWFRNFWSWMGGYIISSLFEIIDNRWLLIECRIIIRKHKILAWFKEETLP